MMASHRNLIHSCTDFVSLLFGLVELQMALIVLPAILPAEIMLQRTISSQPSLMNMSATFSWRKIGLKYEMAAPPVDWTALDFLAYEFAGIEAWTVSRC